MFWLPNSAPDSFTPKNLNFVAFGHPDGLEEGAEEVEDTEDDEDDEMVVVGGGVLEAEPGRH